MNFMIDMGPKKSYNQAKICLPAQAGQEEVKRDGRN